MLSIAFDTAQDDATLQKAISGFHQCAMLASHFQLYEVFDAIVVNLATMTGLLEESDNHKSVPDPIVDVAGQKYVVSHLAVRFGRNYKGQLAAVVVFAVVTRHGNSMRKGWKKVKDITIHIYIYISRSDNHIRCLLIIENIIYMNVIIRYLKSFVIYLSIHCYPDQCFKLKISYLERQVFH